MILSASRRTDIPNYYSDWFYNRIKEGFVYVRNPMNAHQISKVSLSPEVVDCIVFWTKNPAPMIPRLKELESFKYYFHFTITAYGQDIELNVPHKIEHIIPVFQELSRQIGNERVIWRYDPILFNEAYTMEYHIRAFKQISEKLKDYTKRCMMSFVDQYVKNKTKLGKLKLQEPTGKELHQFSKQLSQIAHQNNIQLVTCAEKIDLSDCGIVHGSCIEKQLTESIIGCKLAVKKDKNQRAVCNCVESIDIGTYHTCKNGCSYCYANASTERVIKSNLYYNVNAPILCSKIMADDKISERKAGSLKVEQISIFD